MTTTITTCLECSRPATTRDRCGAHYLHWRNETASFRRYPYMNVGFLPDRILEELDGGSLTSDGLALALDAKEPSVKVALYRLRRRGLVETVKPYDDRTEWRRVS